MDSVVDVIVKILWAIAFAAVPGFYVYDKAVRYLRKSAHERARRELDKVRVPIRTHTFVDDPSSAF